MNQAYQAQILYALQWVNVGLLIAAVTAPVFFVAMYFRSQWRWSMLGRATMYVWADMALVLALALFNRVLRGVDFNPPPISWRIWSTVLMSTFIFATVSVSLWWKAWVAWMVQTHPDKVEQRDRKYRVTHNLPEDIDG